ncbi:MAG: hypothetical protein ACI902_002850 [Psychroserpens sp.]|jgi:hypothetical protein
MIQLITALSILILGLIYVFSIRKDHDQNYKD